MNDSFLEVLLRGVSPDVVLSIHLEPSICDTSLHFYPTGVKMDLRDKPNTVRQYERQHSSTFSRSYTSQQVSRLRVSGRSHNERNTFQRSETTHNERRCPRFNNGPCTFQLSSLNFVLFVLLTPFVTSITSHSRSDEICSSRMSNKALHLRHWSPRTNPHHSTDAEDGQILLDLTITRPRTLL